MCSGRTRVPRLSSRNDRLAVERAAAGRLHVGAEQPGGERRLVQHRHLAGADLARAQARERALGGIAADRFGRGELGGRAHRRVPGVALHVVAAAPRQGGDRRDRDRVARARVAGAEAARVAGIEVRLLRRDAGALGIGDARVDRERRRLAARGDRDRRLGVDRPGVEEVEVAAGGAGVGEVLGIGQAGGGVLGGEAGDVVGGAHGLLERRRREVGAARVAAPLADIDGDADRLVAVALDVLGLALAHRDRQPDAFGDLGRRRRSRRASGRWRGRRRRARGSARARGRSWRSRTTARGWRWSWNGRSDGSPRREAVTGRGYDNDALLLRPRHECPPSASRRRATRSNRRRSSARARPGRKAGVARAAVARRGAGRPPRRRPGRARPRRALLEALRDASRIRSHEARRRQLQYIGKLMRGVDAEPIRAAVAERELGPARDALALHRAERWRAELIADDDAATRFGDLHADADLQQLRTAGPQCPQGCRAGARAAQRPRLPRAVPLHPRAGRAWLRTPARCAIASASAWSRSATAPRAGVYEDKGIPALRAWLEARPAEPRRLGDAPDRRRRGEHRRDAARASSTTRAAISSSPPAAPARRRAT